MYLIIKIKNHKNELKVINYERLKSNLVGRAIRDRFFYASRNKFSNMGFTFHLFVETLYSSMVAGEGSSFHRIFLSECCIVLTLVVLFQFS